jgi:LAO/AO transport system kinase
MPVSSTWSTPVLTCSALELTGIDQVWKTINEHRTALSASGEFSQKRKKQALDWMNYLLDEGLRGWFYDNPEVKSSLPLLKKEVEQELLSPTVAAASLLAYLRKSEV